MSTRNNVRQALLPVGLVLLASVSQAAESCPWLNAATAGGFLGRTVTVTVTHENANRDDATCVFTTPNSELRIAVETMDPPHSEYMKQAEQCGADTTPLKAIGNAAVVCSPNARAARVVGRVRNRIFNILITTTDSSTPSDLLREKARAAAEQVAGILF